MDEVATYAAREARLQAAKDALCTRFELNPRVEVQVPIGQRWRLVNHTWRDSEKLSYTMLELIDTGFDVHLEQIDTRDPDYAVATHAGDHASWYNVLDKRLQQPTAEQQGCYLVALSTDTDGYKWVARFHEFAAAKDFALAEAYKYLEQNELLQKESVDEQSIRPYTNVIGCVTDEYLLDPQLNIIPYDRGDTFPREAIVL